MRTRRAQLPAQLLGGRKGCGLGVREEASDSAAPLWRSHCDTMSSARVKLRLLMQVKPRAGKSKAGMHVIFYMHIIMGKSTFSITIVIMVRPVSGEPYKSHWAQTWAGCVIQDVT